MELRQRDARRRFSGLWISLAVIAAMSVAAVADAGQDVWTSGGPYGGAVSALAIDPASTATLFAGTPGGGVFRSTDSGAGWTAAVTGLTDRTVQALVMNPTTPAMLFAGTKGGGVFRSTDSGNTWAASNAGLTKNNVQALAIDPSNPSTIYAGTSNGGVYRSVDSGGTWEAASSGMTNLAVQALAINPANPSTLYVGTGSGLFKSTDSGGTWSDSKTGLTNGYVLALAIDPSNPATLYAGTYYGGVFKSTDSGGTWASATNNAGLPSSYVRALAINPASPSTVYYGSPLGGVFRSTNAGLTWAAANTGLANLDVRALAIDPATPATLYAGTQLQGVARSSDAGSTWTAASTGVTNLGVSAVAIDPANPVTVYAGTDWVLFKSTDSGASWAAANTGLTNQTVQALAINRTNPATLYAGTAAGGVFKSTNFGGAWAAVNTGLTNKGIRDLAIDPANAATLYAGTSHGVFRSTNSGTSWTAASPALTSPVSALAIDPANPATLYAGTTGGIVKSTDSGATWAPANAGLTNPTVTALAVDPATPATLYAGTVGGVFRSTDAGATWAASSAGLTDKTVQALAIDSANPATLYAGTYEGGVFKSTDSGGTWAAANAGLGNPGVSVLALSPAGANTLYAGLRNGSVWQATYAPVLPPTATSVIPIVLDVDTGSAHYTTELALSSVAAASQTVSLAYTPSLGDKLGGGTVSVSLPAGQQVVYPNVITSLRTLGLQIPEASASAPQGGTLAVTYDPRIGNVYATARTTTATAPPQPVGSAGLAYGGLPVTEAITTRGVVYGLRSTDADRSNLAVYNTGNDPVTVKVTLFSGSGDGASAVVSSGLTLPAFGWYQFDRVLAGVGMTNAWALLERTSSKGAFGAYGVINDNTTNDGSFVALVSGGTAGSGMTLPVLVEAGAFVSEIVLANKGTTTARLALNYIESLTPALGAGGVVSVTLAPGEQRILAGAVDYLRTHGAAIGAKGAAGYAGAVRVGVTGASLADVYVGARTASASSAGGQFGLFTPPSYAGQEASTAAAIYGLKADALSRTNVAVLHAGADGSGAVTLKLDIHDGSDGGTVKATQTLTLNPGQWAQPNGFFAGSGVVNGYVTITRTSGTAPWIAYGVVNDGGGPGEGTGDGAYVPMVR